MEKIGKTLEKMLIFIWYVHKSNVNKRFLGFEQKIKLDKQGLIHYIIVFLNSVNLLIHSYDGRPMMSGSTNEVT